MGWAGLVFELSLKVLQSRGLWFLSLQGEAPDWQSAPVLETTALAFVCLLSLPVTVTVTVLFILEARVRCVGSPGMVQIHSTWFSLGGWDKLKSLHTVILVKQEQSLDLSDYKT